MTKAAPEFCSVYVISKGKILSVRKAQRSVSNTAMPPRAPSGMPPQISQDQIEDDGNRYENFLVLADRILEIEKCNQSLKI